ncbi:MAG TPA: DUF3298 domain-containing protein [Candidatus Paceibacterota bacterium]|jgi:hypothetical protein|nr:DUF3298 domain-containing protein [Candidatus Paceibacterota bacterium]
MQKTIRIFLLVLIIIGIVLLFTQKLWVPVLVNKILSSETSPAQLPPKQALNTTPSVTISTKKIKEENFSGTIPVIFGSRQVAVKARAYIETTVAEFRKQANADVPDMRKEFGANNPITQYEIDIDAKYAKSEKTESIIMSVYTYTGGAHGITLYKVITASLSSGKILSLASVIKKEQQNAFTEFVKKELNNWHDPSDNSLFVFPDTVKDLTFNSFANWSLDEKNLIIYFDQYEIGPGVIGETVFPLPFAKIKDFLVADYFSSTSAWKTFSDPAKGITFQYPENISTTYISTVDWPPKVQIIEGTFVCTNEGEVTSAAGQTLDKKINGRDYCVTMSSEGAAGSTYTNYAYATKIQNKFVSFSFVLRAPNCDNYGDNYNDPQQTACKTERTTFSIDNLIDQIIQTTKIS